jgi:hypothetical protein
MMASGEIRLSTMTMRRMPVLAQSQDQGQGQLAASIPQASGPADYQIDTPITVTAQSEAGEGSFVESLGLGVGGVGASGDWLATNSKIIGGSSALASDFWKLTGESISKWSMIGSTVLDGAQTISTFGTTDSFFHAVDATVDVGVTKLGIVGTGVGLIWTATGGMRGAVSNPALQPLPPSW